MLTHATRRGIQSSGPVIALLGKSFANLEGSIRHLCPELSITGVFEENLRAIMFGLAQEALSEQQAARVALELMIAAPGSLQQGREILRNLADHACAPPTAATGAVSGRGRLSADAHHTRAALILAAAIIWSSRRR
ncbi:hypothetical protein OHA84_34575 [Streptomyces sp. NBC_00513]|uniref:hypothetical protein n=1 Tax=unclassified Streptomyces TaxID=2593676 RepID=UPI00225418C2|nr:hypothetical protein [Streptomyces sp. NBC_00424]MCX5071354.1 hypothetical protein [Streptomyces sp. NBC_00424]WUD45236.1 hypothetical protein OHA84_34575 [Streptomyces sp. NBC_00513]